MDINLDGHKDILVGSFSGVPYIIMGGEEGYSEPEEIMDSNGDTVLIADFWNAEDSKWDETDRADSEGHCTSVSAVDWDNDGDLDLLLGDYYGGRLFLRMNEGTAKQPAFAATNQPVMIGGKPLVIEKGMAAPRIVDWNNDGLFDIMCGGSKGGVYLFTNDGSKGKPNFSTSETLLETTNNGSEFITIVPAVDGHPQMPGSSFHLEPCDYDGDGDLDLLIGARSAWAKAEQSTEVDQDHIDKLDENQQQLITFITSLSEKANEDGVSIEELMETDDFKELIKKYSKVKQELSKYNTNPNQEGDFVWLLRRK